MKQVFSFLTLISLFLMVSGCRDNLTESYIAPAELAPADYSISSPSFGERWDVGTKHTIEWTRFVGVRIIDLVLYKKREFIQYIARDIENMGKFTWQVPDLPYRSHHYQIKVINSENDLVIMESEHFYVLQ